MSTENKFRPLPCASCNRQPIFFAGSGYEPETIRCYGCGVKVHDSGCEGSQRKWDRIQRGLMLLADMPDPGKVLRERLTRLIKTRGEASLGVLVNLVRPIPVSTVGHTLAELVRDKTLKIELRANPRNHKETSIFSLA